ncbi:uncharacterized protein DNG_01822 [Cephalotrichum gorgonifer]|uniref:Methyltransferase type 11 domain-containing protein n=1 Tax=Cephalotrichum gorgonifer TaxID=2041049 RepID=A0AAE8MRG1_9PEZI|nr:uncharacterized protein DNG_01822 [Cephalotrichum gorgonifer]
MQYDRSFTASPTEIQVAQVVDLGKPKVPTVTLYPELDRYRDVQRPTAPTYPSGHELPYRLTTHDLPPPTPGYFSGTGSQLSGMSGSPSTRFSESPGTGPYSRDTTPTSVSSQSPGVVVPIRFAPPRMQHDSPGRGRPPVTRRRGGSLSNEQNILSSDTEGLAAVRESLTSSSSNSTVRGTDKNAQKKIQGPPSSPPPRKSSANQAAKVQSPESTTRKLSRRPTHPAVSSPPPVTANTARHAHAASSRGTPPMRPSRDGTPDMHTQLWEPVPVVHSNLSSTSLHGERRGSEPYVATSSLPRSITPLGNPDHARPTHRRRPSGQGTAAALRSDSETEVVATVKKAKAEPTRLVRTPSPNVSTFNSRFPFFGRKKQVSAPEAVPTSKKDKESRKGPAAGTGHEGYGRMGAIRRRSSGALNPARSSFGLSPSQDTPAHQPQFTDPFLRDRMNPVVISGGEVVENRNAATPDLSQAESTRGLTPRAHSRQLSSDSKISSASTSSSREESRNTLWPSAFPKSQIPNARGRRPSESSDDGAIMKSTIAFRRSVHKLRTSPEQDPVRLPKPINTRGTAPSPLTSFETNATTDDGSNMYLQRETSRGNKPLLVQPKKLTKRSKSPRKWNFFGRSQPQAKASKSPEVEPVAATVTMVQTRAVPFYAMIDSSEQEDGGEMDVMDVLRSAEVCEVPSSRIQLSGSERRPSEISPPEFASPVDTAATPGAKASYPIQAAEPETRILSPPRPSNLGQTAQQARTARPTKQSRLPQVGRIPKVVSTRPERASPRSFSRPFNKMSPQIPTTTTDQPSLEATTMSPSLPTMSTPEMTLHGTTLTSGSQEHSASPALIGEGREFLAFSPRKNSTATTSSSSCCSAIYTTVDTTAIIPSPSAPLAEDEIWDEYNDFLGDMPLKTPPSAALRKAKGLPPVKTVAGKISRDVNLESPTIDVKVSGLRVDKGKKRIEAREEIVSSVYSCDDDAEDNLHPPQIQPSPSTPFSVSQFVGGYGERNNSGELTAKIPVRTSPMKSERNSGSSSRKSRVSTNSSSSKASEDETPLAQVNLRVGSMTVSKWLTFGHVLFSPAREELVEVKGSRESHSVLVLDGLGNDDWSFYAAETYPGATFFNLSPRAPLPEDRRASTAFPLSPKNHYQIQYTSQLAKFPFGPSTFSTVVIRFPTAAPESHYRNLVSEARRVLKPGGYVELSILDLDLNNMGNRGRRTVRRLKERIHARNSDTSLASTADLMLRLLSRKNFADIKSCRVGVPVASSIERATGLKVDRASMSATGAGEKGKAKEQRSLAEMMSDDSELADESIAKMVSKVGRWWYTRCYESVAAPAGGPSGKGIWDKGLLGECEQWGTSLKLMVCHARVPESRVASI